MSLQSLFGSGKGARTNSSSSVHGPEWLSNDYQNLASRATDLANKPYESWTGPYVAAPSADTQAAWKKAENTQGTYQPYLDQAAAATKQGSTAVSQGDVSNLLNPNQKYVTQGLTQNFMKNVLPSIQDKFVGAGQSRSAQEAQVTNNAAGDLNNSIGQSMAGAWSSALGAAQQQKAQQLQAGLQYGQLGSEASQLNQQDISSLGNVGSAQDARAQTTLDSQRQDWEQAKQYPYQQMQWLSSIYGSIDPKVVGLTSDSNTTSKAATKSVLSRLIGNYNLGSSFAQGGAVRGPVYRSALDSVRR